MIALPLWSDRATLLEQSWERHVRAVMGDTRPPTCPYDFECPFLTLRGSGNFWIPLLVLNGTSDSTGRRIVTTSLAPTYRYAADRRCPVERTGGSCRIFAETYDFHDLINPGGGAVVTDVRLSTAASNSARFPFVSPPGEIVPPRRKTPADRIVDGGYLENFGVLSAFDLVNAIYALQPDLKPFVVIISNDPNMPVDPQEAPRNVQDTAFLTDITGFLSGIAATRDARASVGVSHLHALLERQNAIPGCPSLVHVRVWPVVHGGGNCRGAERTAVVSMSWWLSKPVQLRLVAELDQPSCNATAFEEIWEVLSPNSACGTH
jgi:hypothetical protein